MPDTYRLAQMFRDSKMSFCAAGGPPSAGECSALVVPGDHASCRHEPKSMGPKILNEIESIRVGASRGARIGNKYEAPRGSRLSARPTRGSLSNRLIARRRCLSSPVQLEAPNLGQK